MTALFDSFDSTWLFLVPERPCSRLYFIPFTFQLEMEIAGKEAQGFLIDSNEALELKLGRWNHYQFLP